MRIKSSFVLVAAAGLILAAVPILAHHSFAAQFDRNKPVTLTGPVTKIEWINPHARFFMDAKDANGKVANWEIELGSTAGLLRRGWNRTSLKIGEAVTVNGSLAKDGSNLANATTVTLSDGKRVLGGSSGADETTK
jgi:Family of unknown function (DUF6152)